MPRRAAAVAAHCFGVLLAQRCLPTKQPTKQPPACRSPLHQLLHAHSQRDGCPKIINLGSAKTDLFYEKKKYGSFQRR
jgi:PHF5-like protein